MSKSSRQRRLHQAGASQLVAIGGPKFWRLAHAVPRPPALSRRAQARLEMLDWHAVHGRCVALTARHFGWSRQTVYVWLRRYDRSRLASLEDRPSLPRRRRRPSWTPAQAEAVRALRETYPCWGKAKLAVLLRREGICLSVSMVGRIMRRLRRRVRYVSRCGARSVSATGDRAVPTRCASRPAIAPRGWAIWSSSTRSTFARCPAWS